MGIVTRLVVESSARAQLFALAIVLGVALALAWGGEVGVVEANPDQKNHRMRSFCGSGYDGCGEWCLYANCLECTQGCECWETCEYSCRTRQCDERDPDTGGCVKHVWAPSTCSRNCNFTRRTDENPDLNCDGGEGVTCGPREDVAPCVEGKWEVHGWRGGRAVRDRSNPDPTDADFFGGLTWDFESPYFGKALLFGTLPRRIAAHCSNDGFQDHGVPVEGHTGLVAPTPVAEYVDDFNDVARRVRRIERTAGQPTPAPLKSFAREGMGAPYFRLTKPDGTDNEAVIKVLLSSFDRDEDTLQYRRWAYSGFKPDLLKTPYRNLPLVSGSDNVSRSLYIPGSGAWSFQVRKLDEDDEPSPGSKVRTAMFGMNAVIQTRLDWEDLELEDPPAPTPLPTLTGGATRPEAPVIVDVEQNRSVYPHTPEATAWNPNPTPVRNYAVTVTLGGDYDGDIEYRYWTYSGNGFGDGEPEWEAATVSGRMFPVAIPLTAVHPVIGVEEQGRPILLSFEARQVDGGVASEPSVGFVALVWSFRPYELPAWSRPWLPPSIAGQGRGVQGQGALSALLRKRNAYGSRVRKDHTLLWKFGTRQGDGVSYGPPVDPNHSGLKWEYTVAWQGSYMTLTDGSQVCFDFRGDAIEPELFNWQSYEGGWRRPTSRASYMNSNWFPFYTDDPVNVPIRAIRVAFRYLYKGKYSEMSTWRWWPTTYGYSDDVGDTVVGDSHSRSSLNVVQCDL